MAINTVSLTSGMRSNLLSLQGTVDLLNRTQNRLSSGKKVNTAIDNPTSYFASQSLTSRAGVIDSLKDAMGQAVQTITAADKGITAITSMIEQAKGIAQSALSAEAGGTAGTGEVTLDGITAAVDGGFATGTVDLTSITHGTGTGKTTGKITMGAGAIVTGDVITIGDVAFTGSAGAAGTAGGTTSFNAGGATAALDAQALVDAINDYGWSGDAGGETYVASRDGDDVLITKSTTGGGSENVATAADVTLDANATTHGAVKADVAGTGDKIVIGIAGQSLTFTAVSDNAVNDATHHEFLATGNDAMDKLSLLAAINTTGSWAGKTNTYSAAIDDAGKITLTKTITASGAGANFIGTGTDIAKTAATTGTSGTLSVVVNPALTGASDTIRIGSVASIGTATADVGNSFNGTVQSGGAYTGGTDKTYQMEVTTGGALADVVFKYSDDNGATWTAAQTLAAGVATLGAEGVTLTFAEGTVASMGAGDQFTVTATDQGITFAAVDANPTNNTTTHQFLADTTNNTVTVESLKDAINATDWSDKTYTFAATVDNGKIDITKTLTATGADVDVDSDTEFLYTKGTDNTGTATMADVAASGELADLVSQYNTMRTQIDELAEDSGYKGKNLLSATSGLRSLDVKFEGATLNVAGFNATTAADGLNLTSATDGATTAWSTGTAAINASVDQLDGALSTMRQQASALAGNLSIITVRQDFSTNMINTLTGGSDLLTLADANEEGANMLMLQTRQSLSTTALSLSAQAAQSVLKLFG